MSDDLQSAMFLRQIGRLADAERLCASYVARRPNDFDMTLLLGLVQAQQGKMGEALPAFRRAVRLRPKDIDANYNLGLALNLTGDHTAALDCYRRVLKVDPRHRPSLLNFANSLLSAGLPEEASKAFETLIAMDDTIFDARVGNAICRMSLRDFDGAFVNLDRAAVLDPKNARCHHLRGVALQNLGNLEKALASFETAHDLQPDFAFLLGSLCHTRMRLCDWSHFQADLGEIERRIERAEPVIAPFSFLSISASRPHQLASARIWLASEVPPAAAQTGKPQRRKGKIRIGYFSADFHDHATVTLMGGVFESHDRKDFEIIAYSFGPRGEDEDRRRMEKAFDRFVEVGAMSEAGVAELARRHDIDIAVDLKGYTQDARPGIFAAGAAPIQVNFLGYPGTMGAPFIDYIIADPTLVPPDHRDDYSEKIVYLPHSYQPNDRTRRVADSSGERRDHGLPDQGFVFCCFNNSYKVTPEVFTIWMRVLKAVEGSVLWLLRDNPFVEANLRREAQASGIDPDRLVFAPRTDMCVHLARHRHADLFLDTAPYNAHTTASDALWVGLPVLTRMGETFAGRVAASILSSLDVPELITSSVQDYEATAIALAKDPVRLAGIRDRVNRQRDTSPLFDAPRFTRQLEAAYRAILQRRLDGLPPDHISVDPLD